MDDDRELYDSLTDAIHRIDSVVYALTVLAGKLLRIRGQLHGLDMRTDRERNEP